MKTLVTLICFTTLFFITGSIFGQENQEAAKEAFSLHESGKIYVVVAVIFVIFIGIASYLFAIDRKVKKLERD